MRRRSARNVSFLRRMWGGRAYFYEKFCTALGDGQLRGSYVQPECFHSHRSQHSPPHGDAAIIDVPHQGRVDWRSHIIALTSRVRYLKGLLCNIRPGSPQPS
ncbi:hypothetical protein PAXRUDRAFT_363422 [Paxillus rubicundulus Ve08.2h10]|uniref:Uncharacterized protein n=1 Tax=Paxillus rubicundulus Ve08.2h10 TaxID=930991 RepID=A0A0D0DRL0_9AGAM|nr:hypothetical protein PAXRUDRAFT_363422 [Paxillus rubicundulus Ve08.2h10]